jgi:hypothetical protein
MLVAPRLAILLAAVATALLGSVNVRADAAPVADVGAPWARVASALGVVDPQEVEASVLAASAPWLVSGAAEASSDSRLSFAGPLIEPPLLAARSTRLKSDRGSSLPPVLNAERARILLRSLTVPGWGQATLGHRRAATVFAIADLSIWTSFTAFRVQQRLRTDASIRTAMLEAGIDLSGRDEDIRRIVGLYASSEEYNQLVVYRDAANLYYDNPAAYRAYIEAHQLQGKDAWAWSDEDAFRRYSGQRKQAQRAALRSNTALALAIANRLISAVHAARAASHPPAKAQTWNFECVPVPGGDGTAFHLGVRTRF